MVSSPRAEKRTKSWNAPTFAALPGQAVNNALNVARLHGQYLKALRVLCFGAPTVRCPRVWPQESGLG